MSNAIVSLEQLAREINESEARIAQHKLRAVEEAVLQGNLLAAAKAKLPHGEFTPWLEAHCQVAPRTARKYMTLAAGVAGLPSPERNAILAGGIDDAVKKIAAPQRTPIAEAVATTKTAEHAVLPETPAAVAAPDTKTAERAVLPEQTIIQPEPAPQPAPQPAPAAVFDLSQVSDEALRKEANRRADAVMNEMLRKVEEGEKLGTWSGLSKSQQALLKRFKRDHPAFVTFTEMALNIAARNFARSQVRDDFTRIRKGKEALKKEQQALRELEMTFPLDRLPATDDVTHLLKRIKQFCHPDKHTDPAIKEKGDAIIRGVIAIEDLRADRVAASNRVRQRKAAQEGNAV